MTLGAELVTLKVAFSLRADFTPQLTLSKKAKETAVKNIRKATSIVESCSDNRMNERLAGECHAQPARQTSQTRDCRSYCILKLWAVASSELVHMR